MRSRKKTSRMAAIIATTAAYPWKTKGGFDAPEPAEGKTAWQLHDDQLHAYLKAPPQTSLSTEFPQNSNLCIPDLQASIPEALAHTGASAFDAHLRGVQVFRLRNFKP